METSHRMKSLITLVMVLSLGGCAMIPGAHIPSGSSGWKASDDNQPADLEEMVNIHTITPKLLQEQMAKPETTPVFNHQLELDSLNTLEVPSY